MDPKAPPQRELVAADVVVRYGPITALDGVTIAVDPGDLVAVTGSSGAGKTSLLSVLAGEIRPASGTVDFHGSTLTTRADAAARGIVLVPQGNALVDLLTAAENVALPLLATSGRARGAAAATMRILTELGLDDAAGQLVEELSGGQQQRVAVARGVAQGGTVLLADEPTSELDAGNRATVLRLLRAEAERGAAVVVATHDPEVAALCSAELRLDSGVGRWRRDNR